MDSDDINSAPCWECIDFKELTICEVIGGGGVALVHRGIYHNNSVALKILFDPRVDDVLKQEFMDELLVMSKLKHPNVVNLIGACLEPPKLCMVMELCDFSLHHLLHGTNTYLSSQQMTRIASDIANGMRYLHSRKPAVIHRDLKSANVLLDFKGVMKLCDFGLVRTKCTNAGTPSYMPPELLMGQSFSKSVDVYMFGILLYEIFSRDIPFRGYDIVDIKRHVIAGERFRVPTLDCPRECQDLMKRCWDGEPNCRPTFEEVYEILQNVSFSRSFKASQNVLEGDALDFLLNAK
ncbi:tkl protein kinase [Plasmopara halstedii]|uniref:Tkl protein kinase n=1 Tax=Plasmopara halstedii TaxID=4781 RepID=A0A0P1B0A4_PLAHL|nr:tkl protein kinase [Plasmopara halstedii]CEG46602.1 tkl protein kinase [Plasmopara halstedii]|eukprot:XP_024582971.1 tkl protein kinase [Plasmopara halstedii]